MGTWRRQFLISVAIAIATAAAFAPAFQADWVMWDDDQNFLNHSAWRGLTSEHLRWMFTTFHLGPYQPLAWVTLGFDHALWGMDARGFHATSVALQALAAVAFYFLARALLPAVADGRAALRRDACALVAALVFAIHPLRCESVAWITERRDVLAGFFLVLCVLAYVHSTRASASARWKWLTIACVLYAASLLSKGLGMMLPPVLLVLDIAVLRRSGASPNARSIGALVVEKIPFFVLAAIAAVLAWVGQSALPGTMLGLEHHRISARIAQALYGLCFYVAKSIWPSDLVPLVPLPKPMDVFEARFVLSAVAVAVAGLVLVLLRRRAPVLVAAFVCYVILILPVLGLTQTGPQLVADRYSYLACMPFALLAGAALHFALTRKSSMQGASLACAGIVLGLLGVRCFDQTSIWRNTLDLWERTVAVQPDNPLARRNLVVAYISAAQSAPGVPEQDGFLDRALAHCALGIEKSPDPAFLANAASVFELRARQRHEQGTELLALAIDHAQRAIELGTRMGEPLPGAYEVLAVALSRAGRHAEALTPIEWLANRQPRNPNYLLMRGQALLRAARTEEAREVLAQVVQLAPDASMAWIELGEAHAALAGRAEARACYQRGIELERQLLGPAAASSAELETWVQRLIELDRSP